MPSNNIFHYIICGTKRIWFFLLKGCMVMNANNIELKQKVRKIEMTECEFVIIAVCFSAFGFFIKICKCIAVRWEKRMENLMAEKE